MDLAVSTVPTGRSQGGLITNKRSFAANVGVEDGNYVVLSGLIQDYVNDSGSRVPLLASIPLLGALFRSESRTRSKTNTMVFLRPVIIRDEGASSALAADRYEYMRTQFSQIQKPDSLVFQGLKGGDLPPLPAPRVRPAAPTSDVPTLDCANG